MGKEYISEFIFLCYHLCNQDWGNRINNSFAIKKSYGGSPISHHRLCLHPN